MINKAIRKASIISFDIYDTLILRDTSIPEEIFIRVGKKALGKEEAAEYARRRIEAEKTARSLSTRNGEVDLDDIYKYLDYPDAVINVLKEVECRTEIEAVKPDPKMLEYFNQCLELEKPVFLISDMYLPKDVIESCLKKCNIANYSDIYISNEFNVSKRDGRLFEVFLERNKIDAAEVLHIGDSYTADFKQPQKHHIKACWIRKTRFIIRNIRYHLFLRKLKYGSL